MSAAHLGLIRPLIRADALLPLSGQGGWVLQGALERTLERSLPDELVYGMICRDMSTVAFLTAHCAQPSVRFTALAAAVGHISERPRSGTPSSCPPRFSRCCEKNTGAADRVVRLTEQLKVDFARYCEAFRVARARALVSVMSRDAKRRAVPAISVSSANCSGHNNVLHRTYAQSTHLLR